MFVFIADWLLARVEGLFPLYKHASFAEVPAGQWLSPDDYYGLDDPSPRLWVRLKSVLRLDGSAVSWNRRRRMYLRADAGAVRLEAEYARLDLERKRLDQKLRDETDLLLAEVFAGTVPGPAFDADPREAEFEAKMAGMMAEMAADASRDREEQELADARAKRDMEEGYW